MASTAGVTVSFYRNNFVEFSTLECVRLSEKFQSFEPKFAIFEEKSQKWYLGRISGFLRTHPINDFRDFPGNGHSDNGFFHEKKNEIYI